MMKIPSVTQVLSPWANYSHIPEDVLLAASERGIAVHGACFAMCLGVWSPKLPKEWQGYLKSFEWWLANVVEEVIEVEPEFESGAVMNVETSESSDSSKVRITEHLKYIGHPDLIVKIKGDKHLSLWDLKTPLAVAKTWGPQCAAYRELSIDNGYNVTRNFALRLKPNGKPPIGTEYSGNYHFDLAIFHNALACWRYFND